MCLNFVKSNDLGCRMLNFLKTIAKKPETFLYYTYSTKSVFWKYDSLEDLDQIKIRHEDTLMELEMTIRLAFKIKLTILLPYIYYFSFINSLIYLKKRKKKEIVKSKYMTS